MLWSLIHNRVMQYVESTMRKKALITVAGTVPMIAGASSNVRRIGTTFMTVFHSPAIL